MANRTGTYFAFDGLGESDPTKSDYKYYATAQSWDASHGIEFKFTNSHDKASSVRDTSLLGTLQASIRKRLAASKQMVVVISSKTRKKGSLLSYEIEQAVDKYKIPLIIAYAGYGSILNPSAHKGDWPNSLESRINNGSAMAIHIPFKKDAILDAIKRFSVNGEAIGGSLVTYSKKAQVEWGYIE